MNTALFGVELLLLALGLGMASLTLPKAIPLPAAGRFAFGFAATPFIVALAILVATLVWPGVPARLLALTPGILAAALIWCCRSVIAHVAGRRSHAQLRDPVFLVLVIGVVWTAVLIAFRIVYFAQEPLGNSDAVQYLQEAKQFATHRSFVEIAGMRGLEDGTLRGDPHGPLWIAWLASALMWGGNVNGLAHTIVRLPFEASFLFFFSAVVAVASVLRTRYFILVALLVPIAVPGLYGTVTDGYRDSFRLAALLLLSSFLLAHLRPKLSRATHPLALVLGAALVAFCVQGHALALVLVPIVVAAWCLVVLAARFPLHRLFILNCALSLGFIIGGLQVIDAYWRTGSIMGDNVFEWDQVKGTAYEHSVDQRNAGRIGDGADPAWRMVLTVARDKGWPSVVAFLVLIGGTAVLVRRRSKGYAMTIRGWRAVALGAWFVVHTLFLLGVFDLGRLRFGAMTIINLRYAMQWYLAAALLAAWGLAFTLTRTPLLAGLTALALSLGTVVLVEQTWTYYPTRGYYGMSAVLNGLARRMPASCKIISEDTGVNFYAERPVVQLYSKYQRDLLAARTSSELDSLLLDRGFCVVVIYSGLYVDVAGPETPLARLLESSTFRRHDAQPWRIYVRAGVEPKP